MKQKEHLFIVARIDKFKQVKDWGPSGRVLLSDRIVAYSEKRFLVDIISSKAFTSIDPWDLKVGDTIGCIPNGSMEIALPAHLKLIKKYQDQDTTTIYYWMPVVTYPSLSNLIMSDEFEDEYRLARDGSLIDSSFSASRAQSGEEWECTPTEISPDNRIVWYPSKRLSKVVVEPINIKDKIVYDVKHISGDVVLSRTQVKPDVIATHPRKGIIRVQYIFPIDKFEEVETQDGTVTRDQIPTLTGMLIIDQKITEDIENGISNYSYVDCDRFSGFHSYLDSEAVNSEELKNVAVQS